ncbi:MAG: sigma-70 family RNA polymerase sigma factor [Planctomycetaceae bacterium]
MPETSASLLIQLRDPAETQAWNRFAELYLPLILCWARRVTRQEADATDLVQEVFVMLVHKLPEFEYDETKGFRQWLRTVTINKWRELGRKRAWLTNQDELPEKEARLDDEFWEVEHRQIMVRRFLDAVRGDFQSETWQACWACVVDGRTAIDVGQELNLTPGAVRAAKFRVLARLRTEFAGMLD